LVTAARLLHGVLQDALSGLRETVFVGSEIDHCFPSGEPRGESKRVDLRRGSTNISLKKILDGGRRVFAGLANPKQFRQTCPSSGLC
jgi:hypothetical protein